MKEKAYLIIMHEPPGLLFAAPWCGVIEVEMEKALLEQLLRPLRIAQALTIGMIVLAAVLVGVALGGGL